MLYDDISDFMMTCWYELDITMVLMSFSFCLQSIRKNVSVEKFTDAFCLMFTNPTL